MNNLNDQISRMNEIMRVTEGRNGDNSLNEDLINEGYWGSIAAGIVPYCDRTKRFLVGLRSGNVMEPHTWGGFGGKLDVDEGVDESIQEAAIRELSEETGYVGSIRLVKGFVFRDDAHDFQYHNFIGVVSDEFDSHLNWENDDALWLTYDKLLNLPDKHFGLNRFIKESRSLFQSLAFKTVNI